MASKEVFSSNDDETSPSKYGEATRGPTPNPSPDRHAITKVYLPIPTRTSIWYRSPSRGDRTKTYVRKKKGIPVPRPTRYGHVLSSPASEDSPPTPGNVPRVGATRSTRVRQRLLPPASRASTPSVGGASPMEDIDEITSEGATAEDSLSEIQPEHRGPVSSILCLPIRRTPKKSKKKRDTTSATSPDVGKDNDSDSDKVGCLPSPSECFGSPKKSKKKGGRPDTTPDSNTPESSPVQDDPGTARRFSSESGAEPQGATRSGSLRSGSASREHVRQKGRGVRSGAASSSPENPSETTARRVQVEFHAEFHTGSSPTDRSGGHLAQTSRQQEEATSPPPVPSLPARSRQTVSERWFGTDLTADAAAVASELPLVVTVCVVMIDNRCESNKASAASTYYLQGNTQEVQGLVSAFLSGNATLTTMKTFSVCTIANVLKKYLRELPNPVIPVEMYDNFIEFIKTGRTTTSGRIVASLVDLVDDMPAVHRSTLRHLLAHFSRLLRWQADSGVQEQFEKLINVFSTILMRPAWDRMCYLIENIKHHKNVLHELLREGAWGELMPALPPPKVHPDAPPSFKHQSSEERLKNAAWYWAGLSKDAARDLMNKQPDRSFMVRDSTVKGDYTLLVKFNDSVKSIKIIKRGNRYGLTDQQEFPSVAVLINWYQCNSLESYNSVLPTTLVIPVIRSVAPDKPTGSSSQEVEVLRIINQRYKKQCALYNNLFEWYSWLMADTELKSQASDTYEHLLNILDAQIHRYSSQDMHGLVAERETDRERIYHYDKDLKKEIDMQQGKSRLINGELSLTRQEIQHLRKQLELWKAFLREHNMTQDLIDRLADLDDPVWFVKCGRVEATEMLHGTLDGTFLIRPSREENMYALSVVYEGKVTHVKILHERNYYGFSQQSLSFTSLKDFVHHYHTNTLATHNEELDVCLLYPVHMVHVPEPLGAFQEQSGSTEL